MFRGRPAKLSATLPTAGNVDLRFTIAEGKKLPRSPGIILKVGGKAVGKPQLFGLDEDEEIPQKLARKVYGEVEITGMTSSASGTNKVEVGQSMSALPGYIRHQLVPLLLKHRLLRCRNI
jgi:hypothetical protein